MHYDTLESRSDQCVITQQKFGVASAGMISRWNVARNGDLDVDIYPEYRAPQCRSMAPGLLGV